MNEAGGAFFPPSLCVCALCAVCEDRSWEGRCRQVKDPTHPFCPYQTRLCLSSICYLRLPFCNDALFLVDVALKRTQAASCSLVCVAAVVKDGLGSTKQSQTPAFKMLSRTKEIKCFSQSDKQIQTNSLWKRGDLFYFWKMITNKERERRNEIRTGNRRRMKGSDGGKEGNTKQSETFKSNKDWRRPKKKEGRGNDRNKNERNDLKETKIEGDTRGKKKEERNKEIHVERKEERNEEIRKLGEERREGTDWKETGAEE